METLHILVVDDEYGMRRGAERALRDITLSLPDINGEVRFEIRTAATGKELEEKMNEGPTDILLLDHKLPDTAGLDILERLEKSSLDLLTIMITAYASLETAVMATRRGAYDFLAKPFTPEELRERSAQSGPSPHPPAAGPAAGGGKEAGAFPVCLRSRPRNESAHRRRRRISPDDPRTLGRGQLEDYDRMLDRCLIRIDGMRKLIADLLDLTSIESGQREALDRVSGSVRGRPPGGGKRQSGSGTARDLDSNWTRRPGLHGGGPHRDRDDFQ